LAVVVVGRAAGRFSTIFAVMTHEKMNVGRRWILLAALWTIAALGHAGVFFLLLMNLSRIASTIAIDFNSRGFYYVGSAISGLFKALFLLHLAWVYTILVYWYWGTLGRYAAPAVYIFANLACVGVMFKGAKEYAPLIVPRSTQQVSTQSGFDTRYSSSPRHKSTGE
jgi:hypothetical protein